MRTVRTVKPIVCACGWHGQLSTCRSPCPRCGADEYSQVNAGHIAILRALVTRDAIDAEGSKPTPVRIEPASRRDWMRSKGLVRLGPPTPGGRKLRRGNPQNPEITDRGRAVIRAWEATYLTVIQIPRTA